MTNGLEITESGVDIPTAHDSQRILDTRFRYFEIIQESLFVLPTLVQGGAQVIYTHNLGFLPAFDVYDTVLDDYILGSDAQGNGLISDVNRIYFNGNYIDNGWSNHRVMLRVYNVPITEEYMAPIEQTLPVKPSSTNNIGLQILDPPTPFTDTELSKYRLTTRGKALAIQRTGTQVGNSGTNNQITIEHNIGLPPTFLAAYADPRSQWVSTIDSEFLPFKSVTNGKILIFSGVQAALSGTLAYIIFKELGDYAL